MLVVYEDIVSCQKGKIVFEAREKNFMVYCIKSCRKIQKQKNRNFVLINGSEKIVKYAEKNSLCAVPEPVSRLMDAEQICVDRFETSC